MKFAILDLSSKLVIQLELLQGWKVHFVTLVFDLGHCPVCKPDIPTMPCYSSFSSFGRDCSATKSHPLGIHRTITVSQFSSSTDGMAISFSFCLCMDIFMYFINRNLSHQKISFKECHTDTATRQNK